MNPTFHAQFDKLASRVVGIIGQCLPEYKAFLEYAAWYFESRGITRPVVVEIGTWMNAQKQFYEELLGAEYIGIDIDPSANPDIIGHSPAAETVEKFKEGSPAGLIDLLFHRRQSFIQGREARL